jgi:peroxiredoxin
MKKMFFAALSVLMTVACSQDPQKGYVIDGTAEGCVDGDTVYLCEMQGFFGMNPLDSTVVKDGKFKFEGEAEGASVRFIVPIHAGMPTATAMFILENAAIKATLKPEGQEGTVIEGGPSQKLYEELEEGDNKLAAPMEEAWKMVNDSTASESDKAAAQKSLDSLRVAQKEYHKKFMMDHVPSAFSDMLLGFMLQELDEAELDEILKVFGEKQPDFPVYKAIMEQRKAEASTAVGAQYTDFEQEGPDGKMVKVSDYVGKNKLVLVDFWASWCGPCRAEMPAVVKAYEAFHAKGFEIVGVSLDQNKEAWVKAIADLKTTWPQMSDLKGWENAAAQTYHVQSIPANVLINAEGTIVAKDLRGEDLYNKVEELLK